MASEKAEPSVCKFQTEEDVAGGLVQYILNHSSTKNTHPFTVVLSGGSLISTMRKLIDHKNSIPWSNWYVFWLDERVVPLHDKDSNYKLAYDGFLSKVRGAHPNSNIIPIAENLSPEATAADYEAKLKDLVERNILKLSDDGKYPVFDLILVGVGPDGHVASLFPWLYQRYETERWITYVKDSPKPPPVRITMTFPVINWASNIVIVVTGNDVANVVNVALGKHATHYLPLPVQNVYPVKGQLTWMLDNDAASML